MDEKIEERCYLEWTGGDTCSDLEARRKEEMLHSKFILISAERIDISERKKEPFLEEKLRKAVIENVTLRTAPKDVLKIADGYDLVGVYVCSNEVLDKCSMWRINSVNLELSKDILFLKKGSISRAVNSHIFFTVSLDGYFNPATRKTWLYNVKELLRLCRKKSITLSSSRPVLLQEVESIFEVFKIKKKTVKQFLVSNPERMLIRAAVRRYSYLGFISLVDQQESPLKQMLYRCTRKEPNIK